MGIYSGASSAEGESSNIERDGKYLNSSYSVDAINLTADHNEANGIPKAFYANGRMQSKLLVDVDIIDSSGNPVVLLPEVLYGSIELYYQQGSSSITIEKQKDCTHSSNCWGVTPLMDDTFLHQPPLSLSREEDALDSFPLTNASAKSTHLDLWLTSTEVAEFRKICAKIKFNPTSTGGEPRVYDSCQYPQDESAIYQVITPKTYSINDFKRFNDPGQSQQVSNNGSFTGWNYYITPIDSSVSLTYVTKENYSSYDPRDIIYLFNQRNDVYINYYTQGFIYEPGEQREVAAGWLINDVGYNQLYDINQKPGSVTVTQAMLQSYNVNTVNYLTASVSGNPESDGSQPYRFFVYDQYGNPARLKITYPNGVSTSNSWALDVW
jgi:hypothetical protein